MLKNITVFCGSASTCPQKFLQNAYEVGRAIARQGRGVVYGSGSRGSMGQVAMGAQAEGGHVIGINVRRFANSTHTLAVDEYLVAETMQDRKVALIERGDACIAIPGGIGTFDELTEIFSLAQIGVYDKPFGLLNFDGYFDGWLMQLERARQENFLKAPDFARLQVAQDIETLLKLLDAEAARREAQA